MALRANRAGREHWLTTTQTDPTFQAVALGFQSPMTCDFHGISQILLQRVQPLIAVKIEY